MKRIIRPEDVEDTQLRAFAQRALWVAKLEETMEFLEDRVHDEVDALRLEAHGSDLSFDDADAVVEVPIADEHPYEVAHAIIADDWEEADRALEADLMAWLARDPEHWSIFSLVLLTPWRTPAGRWRRDTPRWMLTLGTNTAAAHYLHDPFGRQRAVDLDE
jgi:hypothetical protein